MVYLRVEFRKKRVANQMKEVVFNINFPCGYEIVIFSLILKGSTYSIFRCLDLVLLVFWSLNNRDNILLSSKVECLI